MIMNAMVPARESRKPIRGSVASLARSKERNSGTVCRSSFLSCNDMAVAAVARGAFEMLWRCSSAFFFFLKKKTKTSFPFPTVH